MTILREQVLSVIDRRNHYEMAEDYYDGNVPEVFASRALRKAFWDSGSQGQLNFCRPVVDAVNNRLYISAIQGTNDASTAAIDEIWRNNQLGLEANDIHRKSLTYGDGYAMVWPDENGDVEISFNSPLTTSIVYDPESPRKKLYAVKMWEVSDGTRMNVYWPDRIEKYHVANKSATEGSNWNLIDTVDNPFGRVPVFHFRTQRPFGRPEHFDAYDGQDYINKQFVTSMLVTDYQGASQRWALTRPDTEGAGIDNFEDGDTDRENADGLQAGPGQVWFMDNIEKVGEFKAADPSVFWEPIKDTVRSLASITNTPLHYFEKTGNVPSGEALRVAEAPLIKKVQDREASFGQTWREIFTFALEIMGIIDDVQVHWKAIESLDYLERLDADLKKRNVGLSLAQVMREAGYDEKVIERVIEEAALERTNGDVAGYERQVRVETQNDERSVEEQ